MAMIPTPTLDRPATRRGGLFLLLWLCAATGWLAAQRPVVAAFSLMEAVRLTDSGSFQIHAVSGAFLPESCYYTGQANYERKVFVLLRQGDRELARWPFLVEGTAAPFCVIRSASTQANHTFDASGEFELAIELTGHGIIGRLPFSVEVKGSGDPFNPSNVVQTQGPWSQLAALQIPVADGDRGICRFRVWARGGADAISGEADEMTLQVRHGGTSIYTAKAKNVYATNLGWQCLDFGLMFPDGSGGGVVRRSDVCRQDGAYDVIVERAGKPFGVWRFEVKGGELVHHARSALTGPADQQLLPRSLDDDGRADHLYWAEKLGDDAAASAASAAPAAPSGPDEAQREAWIARSSADRGRALDAVVTDIAVRMDATIAAGDEIIAYGTGPVKGVQFVRVGEDQAQSIPDGQSFSSKLLCVCGKKLVLVQGKQVAVYDTESGSMTVLPPEQVTLARTSGGRFRANPISSSGMLVAVLNDARAVEDRAMVKVLDLSGAAPRVIAMANPDIQVRDVNSIAVDPATAVVVITSQRKGMVYAAPVAPGGPFRTYDLTGQDGIHKDAAVIAHDGVVAYMDSAGTARFRLLNLDSGDVTTLGEMGRTRPYYALAGGSYVFATKPGSGSAYSMALGTVGSQPSTAPGTGDDGPGGNGLLGMAESIELLPGGVAFIAGEAGLGSGEFLQIGDAQGWRLVAGPDGQAVPASDVVGADLLVAFKTGKSNDTRIGYCRFGDGLQPSAVASPN